MVCYNTADAMVRDGGMNYNYDEMRIGRKFYVAVNLMWHEN